MPIGAEFYIRYANAQNSIFRAAESAFKFKFKFARDRLRGYLQRAKFRLPRRINFIFLRRLNLKCALLWRKFKTRFDDQI